MRRRQESHLEWFRLTGHHGQVLSLLAVKPLGGFGAGKGAVCPRQMLAGCCLVLKNRSVTKSAVSARFWLSVSDTFQTQLLLTMLHVRGCSGLLSFTPCSSCQPHLLPSPLWRQLLPWIQPGSSLNWIWGIYLQNLIFNPYHCIDLILSIDLPDGAGLGFGRRQGADGCWFGWLYVGASIGGHQTGQRSHPRECGLCLTPSNVTVLCSD